MSRGARLAAWARARAGVLAIVAVGIAWGTVMHSMGWAQLAHFAEVRALAGGHAEIDRWHWETGDVAWIDGHYYSVKAPGTAALSVPLYLAIDATGGRGLARDAAANASDADQPRWVPNDGPPFTQYGHDPSRALRVQSRTEDGTPVVWALTLLAAVIPSVLLLLLVRRIADRFEPGYGTAAAVTLGLGTILMVFAAEYFSHAISATLGFAAFAVLLWERAGPPRLRLIAAGGLLAGLAVTFEFQLGLVGMILFLYAVWRAAPLKRGLVYAAGAVAGAAPVLAYNAWALGSPFKLAYGDAVAVIGSTGHARLGLNDGGFFGITLPNLDAASDLLLGGRGLLVLTPVLALAAFGVLLMYRRGHRAEALAIAGVALAYFLYNSAYWQPYGGGTPGPRFLIPTLPFLALGLAFAYRRLPGTTLALAIPSALWMLAASLTYPLVGEQGTGTWVQMLGAGTLEHTLATVLGVHSNWIAIVPVLVALAAAIGLAAAATPRTKLDDIRVALAALACWAVVAIVGPSIAGQPVEPLDGDGKAMIGVVVAVAVSALTLAALRYRETLREPEPSGPIRVELALGERSS